MKYLRALVLAALATMILGAASGAGTASAAVLVKGEVFGQGTEIEATLEPGNSTKFEDVFEFTGATCTTSTVKANIERVTPTGNPKGKITTLEFGGCPVNHDFTVQVNGELEIRNIAGTANGTVFVVGTKVKMFNTLLNQNCTANTGAGTDIGTLTGAATQASKATIDINGLIPMEGCSASNARWTGKYEVTTPVGLTVLP